MPFLEEITQKPLFMLSLLAPLIPMVVALLIVVLRYVRNLSSRIAERRAMNNNKRSAAKQQQVSGRRSQQGQVYLEDDEALQQEEIYVEAEMPLEIAPAEDVEQGEANPEVSSEIMQLINDVFVDDEQNELYEILLHNTEDISAQELLSMARDIGHQLGVQPLESQ